MEVVPAQGTGRKFAVELIGTFFLVFTVGASVYRGSALAPLAINTPLMIRCVATSTRTQVPRRPSAKAAVPRLLVARWDAARHRRVLPAAAVSLFDGGIERREAVFPRCWYTCYGC